MPQNSPPSNTVSVLKWLGGAILPPALTLLPQAQELTHHNFWWTVGLIAVYEFLLAIAYLLNKIWQHLEPGWTKDIADLIDHAVRNGLSGYYHHYRQYFIYEYRDLDVKALSTQGVFTLDLEQVFVDLKIDLQAPQNASSDPLRLPSTLRTGTHSMWEYLRAKQHQNGHFVLLGAPGSGKTTLLKYLGLALLHRKSFLHYLFKRSSPQTSHLPHLLPVFLFLRDHASAIEGQTPYSLATAIRTQAAKWPHAMPTQWIEQRLERGKCLILLDGLDEVANVDLRMKVIAWVEQQMSSYGNNRFLITSRPHGYRSNPMKHVTALEIQPFTQQQVTTFVHQWYLANEIKSALRDDLGVQMKAKEGAQDLLNRLQATPALFALSVNPLLSTMIATVHRYRGSLPGKRVALYDEICDVFLGKRDMTKGIQQELSAAQKRSILQPLAYAMMQRNLRDIAQAEACHVLRFPLQRISAQLSPTDFLDLVENGSGLLLQREQQRYSFAHLTFQEYLAAVHIEKKGALQDIITQRTNPWWHETLRLYCAQTDATPLIQACLTDAPPSVPVLILAWECQQEALQTEPVVRAQLNQLLEQGLEATDSQRRQLAAEVRLTRRLQQFVPINETTWIDTSLITHAEYQLFLEERYQQGIYLQPDHWETLSFPMGEATQPVLGVRWSDAEEFCRWITKRETGLWQYRLPAREESKQYGASLATMATFWLNTYSVAQIGSSVTKNGENEVFQALDLAHACNRDLASDLARNRDLARDLARNRSLVRNLARNRSLVRNFARNRGLALAFAYDLALDLDRALNFALDIGLAFDHARNFDLDLALDHARNLDLDLAHDLLTTLFTQLVCYRTIVGQIHKESTGKDRLLLHRKFILHFASKIALFYYNHSLSQKIFSSNSQNAFLRRKEQNETKDFNEVSLLIFNMLYRWDQRIQGILPATEGILLVRERKTDA